MTDLTKLREATNNYIDKLEKEDVTLEKLTEVSENMFKNTKMALVGLREIIVKKEFNEQDINDFLLKTAQMAIDCGNISFLPNLLKESKD